MTPEIHAGFSVKRYGGRKEDYIAIHQFLDGSKSAHPDLRHRAATHNSWFVICVLPRVFGEVIKNSDNKEVSVREIGQWHVMEDFNGSFPSLSDFCSAITFCPWMDNGADVAPSNYGLPEVDRELLYPEKRVNLRDGDHRVRPSVLELAKEYILKQIPAPTPGRSGGCGGGGRYD